MLNLKILQLCSFYTGNKVHKNLFSHLDTTVHQDIYIPVRERKKVDANTTSLQNGTLYFDNVWSWYHRVLFNRKIQKAFNRIGTLRNNISYDIFHAHTWFSDGGIAWLLNKQNNKPYIIAVRNTDINIFYKKLLHLKKTGHSILEKASKVVFISPGYYKQLISILPEGLKESVKNKSVIIPSGIDEFWFENKFVRNTVELKGGNFNLLYVGEINKNKNIENVIKSFQKLRSENINATLTLVGFKSSNHFENRIRKRYADIKGLSFVDKLSEKKELVKYYRDADLFIMPSFTETFGLVYIEALSQGLPIIYSKGQGVDGYFDDDHVGIAVNPKSVDEITNAIEIIYNNYNEFLPKDHSYLEQFKWENIVAKYYKLYSEVGD